MPSETAENRYSSQAWLILVILGLVWGSSFILMKRGLDVYSPSQVAALRIFIAGACMAPFVISRWREVGKENWKYILAVGLLGNTIPAFLFTNAETGLSSSVTGILNALTPLFTLIVGIFLFRIRISIYSFLGVAMGFVGAVILMMFRSNGTFETNYFYGLYIVLATICYAFSINIIRSKLHGLDSVLIAGWALFFVSIASGIFLFTTDFTHRLTEVEGAWKSLSFVIILAVLGTAVSLVLYNRLIKISGALFASSTTYLIPVVALMWGMLDHEKPGMAQLGGLFIILTGVYLVNKK